MARAVSLSVGEISKAAKSSVDKALGSRQAAFPKIPDHRLGFVPPHHWFGFVLSNVPLDKFSLGDAEKLATEVHHGIAASVAGVKGGKPGLVVGGGHITIGFAPPIEIDILEA
jgi:hypothetical protein